MEIEIDFITKTVTYNDPQAMNHIASILRERIAVQTWTLVLDEKKDSA